MSHFNNPDMMLWTFAYWNRESVFLDYGNRYAFLLKNPIGTAIGYRREILLPQKIAVIAFQCFYVTEVPVKSNTFLLHICSFRYQQGILRLFHMVGYIKGLWILFFSSQGRQLLNTEIYEVGSRNSSHTSVLCRLISSR